MKIRRLLSLALFVVLSVFGSSLTRAASITIAPGASPAGGYLPLSAFGFQPIVGVGDESIVNFNTQDFTFAGQIWNRIGLVSNGYAVIGGGTAADISFANASLPNGAAPANILAPFWTDLNFQSGGSLRIGVLTDGVNSWLVADWDSVPNFSSPATLNSFEIWIGLGTTEDITFVYGNVGNGDAGFLTVGAQDGSRTVGANYYFNGTGVKPVNGTTLRVSTSGLPTSVPEPGSLGLLGAAIVMLALAGKRRRVPGAVWSRG